MSVILGLNAFHAGASAALLVDGQPVAAIAEERLNRVKYYARFPTHAIRRCLDTAGLDFKDIDAVAFGRDSSANRAKKIEYALRNPTRLLKLIKTQASRGMVDDLKQLISRECEVDPASLRFSEHHIEHHLAHVASAYFISPWEKCAGFSLDGSGDFVTCMMADCEGTEIDIKHRIYVPHSLGSLYTMICEFIGYQKYGDEGKVMGLAPLGKDKYHDIFEEMVILTDNGVELNPKFFVPFGESQGLSIDDSGQVAVHRHYSDEMVKLFGEAREPYTDIPERDQDLAFGLQRVFEKGYMHLLHLLHQKIPHERIAMSGGCVLNSVANGKMFDETPFTETCIQPAAGDEGLALGAALYVSNSILKEGKRYVMEHSYLGPEFTESEMEAALQSAGVAYKKLDREALLEANAT
ncbi:MAG: carbamoyltransferase, partial [Candidatus Omnitrophica bacterium]|nr:carbamoyltransferase [Candidatus Omnitrophota bacterium]